MEGLVSLNFSLSPYWYQWKYLFVSSFSICSSKFYHCLLIMTRVAVHPGSPTGPVLVMSFWLNSGFKLFCLFLCVVPLSAALLFCCHINGRWPRLNPGHDHADTFLFRKYWPGTHEHGKISVRHGRIPIWCRTCSTRVPLHSLLTRLAIQWAPSRRLIFYFCDPNQNIYCENGLTLYWHLQTMRNGDFDAKRKWRSHYPDAADAVFSGFLHAGSNVR